MTYPTSELQFTWSHFYIFNRSLGQNCCLSLFNFIPNPSKGCISQCTRSSMLCRLHTLRPTVRAVEYFSITTGHKAWVIRLTYICHWSGQCSDQPPLPKHRQVYTGQHNVTFVEWGGRGILLYHMAPSTSSSTQRTVLLGSILLFKPPDHQPVPIILLVKSTLALSLPLKHRIATYGEAVKFFHCRVPKSSCTKLITGVKYTVQKTHTTADGENSKKWLINYNRQHHLMIRWWKL